MGFIAVAPFEEMALSVKTVSSRLGMEVPVLTGDLQSGVLQVRQWLVGSLHVDVIVSRGGTAKLLERELAIPVISVEITPEDLMNAILEAKELGSRIGVAGFQNVVGDSRRFSRYLNVEVEQLEISHSDQAEETVRKAADRGIDVIVGDNVAVTACRNAGIKSVRVRSGEGAIEVALKKADEFSRMRRTELLRNFQLNAILEAVYEGIVAVDAQNIITLVNKNAEKYLMKEKDQLLGADLGTILPEEPLNEAVRTKKPVLGILHKVQKRMLVFNVVPILFDDEVHGMSVTISSTDYVESVERKVRERLYLKGHVAQYRFDDIITDSANMHRVIEKAKAYAATDYTILITGESGTGKEMLAQSIHNLSRRSGYPFVAINAAAMPENLLESELFGYEEGAFTGARKGGKKGLFEIAHNGTLFLDEIGDLSLNLQARLLRVLQEKVIMRVGGDEIISVDVRVIAATLRDLENEVHKGAFRQDLYYRLNVLRLAVPSLNERLEDIPKLVELLSRRLTSELGVEEAVYEKEVLSRLSACDWTGNIRELENILLRLNIMRISNRITVADLDEILEENHSENLSENRTSGEEERMLVLPLETMDQMELSILAETLRICGGNKEEACRRLGISKTTLWRRLKELE